MVSYWALGFLWGSSRFSGDYLLVQNKNKSFLQRVKNELNISNKIFETVASTDDTTSYRLKINKKNKYINLMLKNGYTGRKGNVSRNIPHLKGDNEQEFLKGYFSTHYSLDEVKRNGKFVKRLRFYASENILMSLNHHLYRHLGIPIKKIGNHSANDVCKILYYQSQKEIPLILKYLDL